MEIECENCALNNVSTLAVELADGACLCADCFQELKGQREIVELTASEQ